MPCPGQDAEQRLLYVAALAVGAYPSVERTYKPFNPLLGETFEFHKGTARYVAEQARRGANMQCFACAACACDPPAAVGRAAQQEIRANTERLHGCRFR